MRRRIRWLGMMSDGMEAEATPGQAGTFWAATHVLMGLTHARNTVDRLLQGVMGRLKESVTYQAILAEGDAKGGAEEARRQRGAGFDYASEPCAPGVPHPPVSGDSSVRRAAGTSTGRRHPVARVGH
jgi:hypothetical protein